MARRKQTPQQRVWTPEELDSLSSSAPGRDMLGTSGKLVLLEGEEPWVWWHLTRGPDVHVRLDTTGPRIVVTAVCVYPSPSADETPASVRASDLRDVPLGRLEAMVNDPAVSETVRTLLTGRGDSDEPNDQSQAGTPRIHVIQPSVQGSGLRYRLSGVQSVPRPDAFYAGLATIWSDALGNGNKNPAVVIADANRVSTSAVHRWVREARRRGVMAPSSRATKANRKAAANPHEG